MSSLIQRRKGGNVKIHDKDIVESVISDGQKAKTELDFKSNNKKSKCPKAAASEDRVASAPHVRSPSNSVDSKSLITQTSRAQDWLNEKTIKDLQEKADQESQAAKSLYNPLLETEATFVQQDVGSYLSHKDLVDLRKKEVLHKRWSDQVYEPIRRKILAAMDGTQWDHLDRRKREMHRQFLEHVNKRGFVFLEDDDREEYYAQALNDHRPSPIKIKTEALSDPLLTLDKRRCDEDRVVMKCMTGQTYTDKDLNQIRLPPLPLVPLGRHGITDSTKWLEMPLNNIESECRHRSRRRMLGVGTKTDIDFARWAQTGWDPKRVEQELQIPRRRYFDIEDQPPYGRPPAHIPKGPFIDPEDFSDKVINTNPFPEHLENLKSEYEKAKTWFDSRQGCDDPPQPAMLAHA